MLIKLANKSILNISGDKACETLQGLITNNINNIDTNAPMHTLFLNNKGRVLFICMVYKVNENSFSIEVEKTKLMDLAKHINHYSINKVDFNDLSDEYCIAISFDETLMTDPRNSNLPNRAIVKKDSAVENDELVQKYENIRLENTIAEQNDFIFEKSLANDLLIEQTNAIDFAKGCYLGQELTSKTKHIKPTKNLLVTLDNSKLNIKKSNTDLYISNDIIGATFSLNSTFALAIIKRLYKEEINKITI